MENFSRLTQFGSLNDPIVVANQKMLQTYRGNDNMKLKIIDQSVLKTLSSLNRTTTNKFDEQLKSSPSPVSEQKVRKMMVDESCDGPKRKSIFFDTGNIHTDNRNQH